MFDGCVSLRLQYLEQLLKDWAFNCRSFRAGFRLINFVSQNWGQDLVDGHDTRRVVVVFESAGTARQVAGVPPFKTSVVREKAQVSTEYKFCIA